MGASKYIISGGGSGGHIFPAVAIANELRFREPDCEILFVGANGKMEMEKIPLAGYKIIGLDIAGFQRKDVLRNWNLPFKIVGSLWSAFKIVKDFNPNMAIGVGGYASGPLLFAASLLGVPTLIQEQNAVPGLTNKILSKRASVICAAYEQIKNVYPGKNVVVTGNPVRKNIVTASISKKEACEQLQLDDMKPVVLIIGGSLGAKTFNESVKQSLDEIRNSAVQFIWQTGGAYYDSYKEFANGISNLHCLKFIDKMDVAYAASDVVISRAGAMSISELQILGKPAILVPSPNVTDDQQTFNVKALVDKNAAIMITDKEAPQHLIKAAVSLCLDAVKKSDLSKEIKKMALDDASVRIVDEIIKLKK